MKHLQRHFRFGGVGIAMAAAVGAASPVAAAEANPFLEAAASTAPTSETAQERANKQVVLGFYAALRQGEGGPPGQAMRNAVEKYMSPDYKQNSERYKTPGPGTERDKLMRGAQRPPPQPGQAPAAPPAGPRVGPDTVVAIMARGDLVMMLTSRELLNPVTPRVTPVYIFNMFRVKDGKLVEHWDVLPGELDQPRPTVAAAGVPAGATP